eukprot:118964-Chlamydomonas_euryale.AAC.1
MLRSHAPSAFTAGGSGGWHQCSRWQRRVATVRRVAAVASVQQVAAVGGNSAAGGSSQNARASPRGSAASAAVGALHRNVTSNSTSSGIPNSERTRAWNSSIPSGPGRTRSRWTSSPSVTTIMGSVSPSSTSDCPSELGLAAGGGVP